MAVSIVCCILFFILLRNTIIKVSQSIIFAGFLLLSLSILISYSNERNLSDEWADILGIELFAPSYIFYIMIIILCVLLFAAVQFPYQKFLPDRINGAGLKKSGNIFIYLMIIFLTGISAFNHYKIDFSSGFDRYHLHAYLNSITNFFWGIPYSGTINSIYGHYGFFYYPFLKLAYSLGFHNLYKIYLVISTLLIVCTLLSWSTVLLWNIKNRFIQFLGILMIFHVYAARQTNIYHQREPHRSFPIAVMILLLGLWYRAGTSKKRIITIIGYIYCVFSVIWNTEYGIFCLISWASLHICTALQRKKPDLLKIAKNLAAIPCVFLCALLVCGFLNKLQGGEFLSLHDFIYPLLQPSYMNELEMGLPGYPSAWMSIMILISAFLAYGLKDTILFTADCQRNDRTAVIFSTAVLGLGTVSYAVNRPAYRNFYVIMPFAAFFISLAADSFMKGRPNFGKNKSGEQLIKASGGLLSLFVLFITAISTIINIPYNIEKNRSYKNNADVMQTAEWINTISDKKALSVGGPISLIYTCLGRDPGFYTMDIPDINYDPRFTEDLKNKLRNISDKNVFISNDVYKNLPDEFLRSHELFSDFYLKDSFQIQYWKSTLNTNPEEPGQ